MSYGTNRIQSPARAPHLFRRARFSDITDSNVCGFYNEYGEYWRKNGKPKTWKRDKTRARVPVKFGLRRYGTISDGNIHYYYVRLDEIKGGNHGQD